MTAPLTKALLRPDGGTPITVQFNPASVQLELSNSLENQGRDPTRRQLVTASTGRLSLELQFDTTVSGASVRDLTLPIKRLLRPDAADTASTLAVVPPRTSFEWGSFSFSGIVESYRETLDFWSAEGVPLRALVSLSLTQHTEPPPRPRAPGAVRRPPSPPATSFICTPTGLGGAAGAALASGAGDSTAMSRYARSVAGANGEESLRSSSRSSLAVPAGASAGRGPVSGGDSANLGQGSRLADTLRVGP